MKWFKPEESTPHIDDDLDEVLVTLQPYDEELPPDKLTIRDFASGCFVTGMTGSGKTSSSQATFIKSFLRAGFGGLMLCTKIDDCDSFCRLIDECERTQDRVIIGVDEPQRFDFLLYEATREGLGGGLTFNLVRLFEAVLEVTDSGQSGMGEQYWKLAQQQLLRRLCDLSLLARGTVTLKLLYDLLNSAPRTLEEANSDEWQDNSLLFHCLHEAKVRMDDGELTERQSSDLLITGKYFMVEFPALSSRTRSIIVSMFSSMADGLLTGYLAELFCSGEITIRPENTWEKNKIVILNLPVHEFETLGRIGQAIFTLAWKKAIQRRNLSENKNPAFLIADECQYHIVKSFDQLWQTTARSSRALTLYSTQSFSNLLIAFGGGELGRSQASSLLNNLNLKVFHANSDPAGCTFASDLIGRKWSSRLAIAKSRNRADGLTNVNTTTSEQLAYLVEPYQWGLLRKGGKPNDYQVDAIVHMAGKKFSTGDTYLPAVFRQR